MYSRIVASIMDKCAHGADRQVRLVDAWAEKFNTINDGRNGRATVHSDPTTHDTRTLRGITVVFDVCVKLLRHCSIRVLDVDAAHLQRYSIAAPT